MSLSAEQKMAVDNLKVFVAYDIPTDSYVFTFRYDYRVAKVLPIAKLATDDGTTDKVPLWEEIWFNGQQKLLIHRETIGTFSADQAIASAIYSVYTNTHEHYKLTDDVAEALWRRVAEAALKERLVLNLESQSVETIFRDVMVAAGFVYDDSNPIKDLLEVCPALNTQVQIPTAVWEHPKASRVLSEDDETRSLQWIIIEMNDAMGWTRERIADWLESLDLDLTVNMEES